MKHSDLPHVEKFDEIRDDFDRVVTFLEDMQQETGQLPNKKTAVLCRDTIRCLQTLEQIIEHVKTNQL